MNRHWLFWLTFGSFITMVEIFLFILICSCTKTIQFHKEYCLFLFPNLIYMMFQFVVNYGILTELLDDNGKEICR